MPRGKGGAMVSLELLKNADIFESLTDDELSRMEDAVRTEYKKSNQKNDPGSVTPGA